MIKNLKGINNMTKFKKKSEEVEAFKWILGSPNTLNGFIKLLRRELYGLMNL
ncbi:hypothetical protein KK425_03190 [Clostridioides difficile]|nr:hypothetical protein [Clostridioides difficile]